MTKILTRLHLRFKIFNHKQKFGLVWIPVNNLSHDYFSTFPRHNKGESKSNRYSKTKISYIYNVYIYWMVCEAHFVAGEASCQDDSFHPRSLGSSRNLPKLGRQAKQNAPSHENSPNRLVTRPAGFSGPRIHKLKLIEGRDPKIS